MSYLGALAFPIFFDSLDPFLDCELGALVCLMCP